MQKQNIREACHDRVENMVERISLGNKQGVICGLSMGQCWSLENRGIHGLDVGQ
jgi:hypothetical protein